MFTPVPLPSSTKSLLRLLTLFPFPRLAQLALFCLLYTIAEYTLTTWYVGVYGFIWKPAFPWSWRLLLVWLCAVPAFSFLHLLWLAVRVCQWWRGTYVVRSPSYRYTMLPRGEVEEDGDARPYVQRESRLPSDWPVQLPFWLVTFCISLSIVLHYQHAGDVRYRPSIAEANAHPNRAGYANQGEHPQPVLYAQRPTAAEKVFIAALFYNNAPIIPYWSDSLVKAIRYLGEDNVFVSIVESESKDRSPVLLQQLDGRLDAMGVSRRILTQDRTVTRPVNMTHSERIALLSTLRNHALEPLVEGGGYDKVLFSNDVYVEPETMIELLHTADGEYDMACGMDFSFFGLYDLWVLRDKRGRLASTIWPYFFDAEAYEAMKTESPVPVFTCWNGMTVFQADPVLPIHLRSNRTLSTDPLPYELPATHPAAHDPSLRGPNPALTPPARFRASAPGECFSSESFLLPYDLRRVFNLQRILVNPRVIVAYDWRFYKYFKWIVRHPVLKWWVERVYDGAWMQKAVLVVGDAKGVSQWDGGDCHPWE